MAEQRLFAVQDATPELYCEDGDGSPIRVYRNILDLEDIEMLQGFAAAMIDEASAARALTERGFYSSPILPVTPEDLSDPVLDVIGLAKYTARVNVQGPGKKQGWHIDYRPEAAVLYPEGEGVIDVNPVAKTLKEARRKVGEKNIFSIPVHPGDIAIIGCGAQVFHRGRNLGREVRRNIVLHDIPE